MASELQEKLKDEEWIFLQEALISEEVYCKRRNGTKPFSEEQLMKNYESAFPDYEILFASVYEGSYRKLGRVSIYVRPRQHI